MCVCDRAARQLKAFWEGSEFKDWTQHSDTTTHLEDPASGTGLDIRTYCMGCRRRQGDFCFGANAVSIV